MKSARDAEFPFGQGTWYLTRMGRPTTSNARKLRCVKYVNAEKAHKSAKRSKLCQEGTFYPILRLLPRASVVRDQIRWVDSGASIIDSDRTDRVQPESQKNGGGWFMKLNISKSPKMLGESIAREEGGKKLVLSLDLASTTGYAFHYCSGEGDVGISPKHMGQLDLSAGPFDSGAIRFVRLRQFLSFIKPDAIFYEEVKVQPAGIVGLPVAAVLARVSPAAELIGAFKTTVCTWAEEGGIPCTGFSIGTIKKRATGRGNSNKEDIIKACNELFGTDFSTEGYETTGVDNIADAAFCLLLGLEQYGAGICSPVREEAVIVYNPPSPSNP